MADPSRTVQVTALPPWILLVPVIHPSPPKHIPSLVAKVETKPGRTLQQLLRFSGLGSIWMLVKSNPHTPVSPFPLTGQLDLQIKPHCTMGENYLWASSAFWPLVVGYLLYSLERMDRSSSRSSWVIAGKCPENIPTDSRVYILGTPMDSLTTSAWSATMVHSALSSCLACPSVCLYPHVTQSAHQNKHGKEDCFLTQVCVIERSC